MRLPSALAAGLLAAMPVRAAESPRRAVVWMGGDSAPYVEALEGLRSVLGEDLVAAEPGSLPEEPAVLIAVGGRAATADRPEDVPFVTLLTPGVRVDGAVCVAMVPEPGELLARLRAIQPGLLRLNVPYASSVKWGYVRRLAEEGRKIGLWVEAEDVGSAEGLPGYLRGLRSVPEAIWIPPDPGLLTPQGFSILEGYATVHRVPLYVPNAGLIKKGAAAAVSVSFFEMGRAAGKAAVEIRAGGNPAGEVYPEPPATAVGRKAARNAGLELDDEALAGFEKVLP